MNEDGQAARTMIVVGEQWFDVLALDWAGVLPGHPTWLHDDGVLTFLVGEDGWLRALEPGTARVCWARELPGRPRLLAVGHDDILVATPDELWLYGRCDGVGREVAWFEDVEIEHLAHLGGYAVLGLSDSSVRTWNLVSGEEVSCIPAWPIGGASLVPAGYRPMGSGVVRPQETWVLPTRRVSFCVMTELELTFDLRAFDPHGNLLWQKEIEHTALRWLEGEARVLEKRIELRGMGPRWLLFGPCGPGHASVLLRLAAGEVTAIDADVTAVVEDAGGWVRGLMVVDAAQETLRLLEPDGLTERWRLSFEFAPCDVGTVCWMAEGLAVALYHPFQPEVYVFVVDVETGELAWRTRLAIPRTSYRLRHHFNAVELLAVGSSLVVRMSQAPQVFVRVLDRMSGQCVFPLWNTLADRLE